jgi:hypothetical protein
MRPIEEWFFSDETGRPFRHCVACRLPLLEIDAPWVVNKEHARGECVLEYAICEPCRDRLTAEIPETTKAAVRGFIESEIDWEARFASFFGSLDHSPRFSHCIACRRERDALDGFAISALFDGEGHLVIGPLPLLICRVCYSRMTGLLCETGREVWRRFMREHFDHAVGDGDPGII